MTLYTCRGCRMVSDMPRPLLNDPPPTKTMDCPVCRTQWPHDLTKIGKVPP